MCISRIFPVRLTRLADGKLSTLGLPSTFLDFLNSYLQAREGRVTVEGAMSRSVVLCDMVFQGTVLGPALWNVFFASVADVVPAANQEVNLFADDLTGYTSCPFRVSNEVLYDELREMQTRTHEWGCRNQVSFDPAKENFQIVHPLCGDGSDFKFWEPCSTASCS